jgi:hypothetical protein
LRVRFLRTACPACWLLDVSRLIASRMVFRAQGESPAPRSWERRATCSRRVVRRVCSELIMWYRKLTILDRISKRHSRPLDFPLAPLARLELPSRAPRDFPLARLATRVGLSNRGSKSEWAHGGSASWWGGWRLARRGGPRRPHSAARVGGAPLPCARHFLWGTFLKS